MTGRKQGATEGPTHRFGGDWTATKLEILRRYLEAYTTALKNQPFRTAYIDAFAGTGYRTLMHTDPETGLLFSDLAEEAPQKLLEGSAKIALGVQPGFDQYIFIEKDPDRCAQLEELRKDFPDRADAIKIEQGDANQKIQALCRKNWKKHRAVLFLDPYGMEVEWKTIESIAATGAIDLWLLLPWGIGPNRLLTRSGQIPEGWRNRLNLFFGSEDWYQEFYREETQRNLFSQEETTVVKAGIEVIGGSLVRRLSSVFPGVAPNPRILMNSANCPLYLFCFAVSSPNPRARTIALGIAKHLLEHV